MSTKRRIFFLLLVLVLAVLASLPAPQPAWSIKICGSWCGCSLVQPCWCTAQQQVTSCGECLCIH